MFEGPLVQASFANRIFSLPQSAGIGNRWCEKWIVQPELPFQPGLKTALISFGTAKDTHLFRRRLDKQEMM